MKPDFTQELIESELESRAGSAEKRDITIADVTDALDWTQQQIENVWHIWEDNIEHNEFTVVGKTDFSYIVSIDNHSIIQGNIRRGYGDKSIGDKPGNDQLAEIVAAIHREYALDNTDYDWDYKNAAIVRETEATRLDSYTVESGYINGE